MGESKLSRYERLASTLMLERSSFESHWRDLGDFILPRRLRFTVTDNNKGDKRYQKIIDSTATLAARTLASGMMSGVTSPARPWFRLTTPDPELSEISAVKRWLHLVTTRMNTVFLRSNLYNVLPTFYGDLGTFATAAIYVEEDFEGDVVRFYPFPVGSYAISVNEKLRVDTFYREFTMTVRQLVEKFAPRLAPGKFDMSRLSTQVQRDWTEGNYETQVHVCHLIHPNPEWRPDAVQSQYKRYASCYWEKGAGGELSAGTLGNEKRTFLRESGYDKFPVLVGRWEKTGEDAYGTNCPGMLALGDAKALQTLHKRAAQAREKGVNPPMVAPTEMRTQKASIVAGDITYMPRGSTDGFRAAHEVRLDLNHLLLDIQDHQRRMQRAYFEDLFLMLAQTDRREITAREIDERHEEKLLALGPVLEQLNQDLLDPLIDLMFDYMMAQGLIPPAPEELQGMDLKVEYVSIMAQAQKMVGLAGMDRLSAKVIELAQVPPEARPKKMNFDQYLDEYAGILGTPPTVIRSDEEVAAMEQAEAAAMQRQQQAEQMAQTAKAAKDLAGADMGGDNALNRLAQVASAGSMVPQQ